MLHSKFPFSLMEERNLAKRFFGPFEDMLTGDEIFFGYGRNHHFHVDIKETTEGYIILSELPGYKKDEINIGIEDDILTIKVKRHEPSVEKGENLILRERYFGELRRKFKFHNINKENTNANYKDGILTIQLYKNKRNKEGSFSINIE